jgi:predicted amidohydrolase YtcJ
VTTRVLDLPPDLVLHNGKIVTVDSHFSIAEAVAVKEDRFIAVGGNEEILALSGPKTEAINLRGRTVLPGLIDSHNHMTDVEFGMG